MDDAIAAFLEYLAVERGASPHTVRGYAGDLRELSAFLRATGDCAAPAAVDMRAIVRAYLASLHRRGPREDEHRAKARRASGAAFASSPGGA